jgi:hypothetical protein
VEKRCKKRGKGENESRTSEKKEIPGKVKISRTSPHSNFSECEIRSEHTARPKKETNKLLVEPLNRSGNSAIQRRDENKRTNMAFQF